MNNKKASKNSLRLPRLSYSSTKSPEKNKRKEQPVVEDNGHKLTATAYAIFNHNMDLVAQYNYTAKRQIASLTKMMTTLCTVRLCQKFKINRQKCYFRVTVNAAGVRGTSAQLQARQWVTVQDLLYGLMLPSGNDAATVLAQNLGACLYYDRLGQAHLLHDLKSLDLTEDTWNIKIYMEQFIKLMNSTAKEIGMKETNYANPHGLDCSFRLEAYSTVQDQALLAKTLLDMPECLKVMSTQSHTADLKTTVNKQVEIRKKLWKNTHLLLSDTGFIGGKTGQTQNAGNCLASYYQSKKKNKFIIVVVGCGSKELRFSETRSLVDLYLIGKDM